MITDIKTKDKNRYPRRLQNLVYNCTDILLSNLHNLVATCGADVSNWIY